MIPNQLLGRVAHRFRILGEETRLVILQALMSEGEMSVGELVEHLNLGQANVSKHLRVLHEAGMIARRAQGTNVRYRIDDSSISNLCELVCDRLKEQLLNDAALVV